MQVFTKSGAEQHLIRRALYLKQSLEAALQKHKELHIDYKSRVCRVVSQEQFFKKYLNCYELHSAQNLHKNTLVMFYL